MIELNYKEFGHGEPIIILHGLFGSLDNWQTVAKILADSYTVYILDQRNHGRSPHTKAFNYNLLSEDLLRFMQSHWIHKAHVIGHSMGAKAAMQFAINHEDYVDKLIAIDMGPKKYDSRHYTIFNTLLSIPVRKMDNRQEVEEMLHQEIPQAAVRQFLMKNLSRKKKGGFKWKMNLKILYKHYEEILAEINGEKTYEGQSLFIRGGMSDYVLDADFEFIQNIFPNGKIKTIPEAGHWVHVDARDRLIEMIRQFIAA